MTGKLEVPVKNAHFTLREEFDDYGLLFNPDSGKIYGVNFSGIWIWKHINGTKTIQELVVDLKEEFSDIPENIGEIVTEYIDNLILNGFLEKK